MPKRVCGPSRSGVGGEVGRVVEIAHARLDARVEHAPLRGEAQDTDTRAGRAEIIVVAEIGQIADAVDEQAGLVHAPALHVEARAERELEEIEVDVLELLVEIGGRVEQRVEFDAVALALQVVRIMDGADIERAPPRPADRFIVDGEVDALQRDVLRAGAGIGVALPADGREERGGEGGGSAAIASCCR